MDKEWDQKYIGNPANVTDAKTPSASSSPKNNPQPARQQPLTLPIRTSTPQKASASASSSPNINITPPASASPRRELHPSNPFSPRFRPAKISSHLPSPPTSPQDAAQATTSAVTSSPSPPYSKTVPPNHRSNPNRSLSAGSTSNNRSLLDDSQARQRSSSATTADNGTAAGQPRQKSKHVRHRSLNGRFPGDMSHRPLDQIKRETRAADRVPHRRHRRGVSNTDTIDALDTIGGTYHHDGPYEATLASRNTNALYSPLAAVKDSNMEAIRATPREYIEDSLQRRVPLQGTSTVPNGGLDFSGNVMTYEEGADLMREADAAGGAYKRWDGIRYHPDDLKGKGEPSYTLERDLKRKKGLLRVGQQPGDFEMQPRTSMRPGGLRQRSASNVEGTPAGASSSLSPNAAYRDGLGEGMDGGVHRSKSTGGKLSEGLKRRFGSIRRKKNASVSVLE